MERAATETPLSLRAVQAWGVALTGLFIAALLLSMQVTSYDTWGAILIAPFLLAISLPALSREADRLGDRRFFWVLMLALVLKLLSALARYYVAFHVYKGSDAAVYHVTGVELAQGFRAGHLDPGPGSLPPVGSNFIDILTGVVYTIIGPSRVGGFLVFSWIGFWGLFLLYRAHAVAFPESRRRHYALLLFFLPTALYWPSSIGKEAWMVFAIGVSAFGAARALCGKLWPGIVVAGGGIWLAGMVRPHVAGMLGVALAAALLLRPSPESLRQLAPLIKATSAAILIAGALMLVGRADQFLEDIRVDTSGGVTSTLKAVMERTGKGGSSFTPTVVTSPAQIPLAALTVLFRPFLFEAHNFQAAMSALEGSFLFALSVFRIPSLLVAARSLRRRPYVMFALTFCGLFIIAFSSFGNFGILVRERAQLLPIFLVLLFVPPAMEGSPDVAGP